MDFTHDFETHSGRRRSDEAHEIHQLKERVAALEEQQRRVSNLCAALISLIQAKGLATDEEIATAVESVDKQRREAVLCKKCGKVLQRGLEKCIYCGETHGHVIGVLP